MLCIYDSHPATFGVIMEFPKTLYTTQADEHLGHKSKKEAFLDFFKSYYVTDAGDDDDEVEIAVYELKEVQKFKLLEKK